MKTFYGLEIYSSNLNQQQPTACLGFVSTWSTFILSQFFLSIFYLSYHLFSLHLTPVHHVFYLFASLPFAVHFCFFLSCVVFLLDLCSSFLHLIISSMSCLFLLFLFVSHLFLHYHFPCSFHYLLCFLLFSLYLCHVLM